jgi:hypothetical protein
MNTKGKKTFLMREEPQAPFPLSGNMYLCLLNYLEDIVLH